jgi:cyclic-di-GMP-binding biofilm dispersal mediator protein
VSVALPLLLDLESPESIATLAAYINASEKLDGVVLASGRVGFGGVDTTTAEQARKLMQINYLGQAELIATIKPAMNQGSFIAAITGVVAEKTFPGMAAYCASKSALSAWLSSTSSDWRKSGVSAIELRPGHTETGLATRPLFGQAPQMPTGMTPEHVVDRIMSAIDSRESVVPSTAF